MTDPDMDEVEETPIPQRRLAYLLLDEENNVVGRTILFVNENEYDNEKERLDAAHDHVNHILLDEDVEIPEVGTEYE